MNNKTFWLGFLAIYVAWQILAYLTHNVLLAEHYEVQSSVFRPAAERRDMAWMLYASSAAFLFLFCQVFALANETRSVAEGMRFGLLLGLFFSIPAVVDNYVLYPITPAIAGLWFMAGVISFVIAGGIFATIWRPSRV